MWLKSAALSPALVNYWLHASPLQAPCQAPRVGSEDSQGGYSLGEKADLSQGPQSSMELPCGICAHEGSTDGR